MFAVPSTSAPGSKAVATPSDNKPVAELTTEEQAVVDAPLHSVAGIVPTLQ